MNVGFALGSITRLHYLVGYCLAFFWGGCRFLWWRLRGFDNGYADALFSPRC